MNYKVSEEMSQRLLSDPENAIVSITNTLDYYEIKYVVVEVPKTAIGELPNIFIAQISDGKNSNLIIVEKLNEKFRIQTNYKKYNEVNFRTFIENWTGFILVIEENKVKQTTSNILNGLKDNVLLIFALVFGVLLVYLSTSSLLRPLSLILSFFGVLFSVFIFKEKTSSKNIESRFCSISSNSSCKSVLSSKSSRVFNIDLVDICIVYFIFTSSLLVFNPGTNILFVSSLVSIPVVVYSIYLQYFKIKKWCPLCLGVSAILIIQLSTFYIGGYGFLFNKKEIIFSVFILSTIISVWAYIKPYPSLMNKNYRLVLENLKFRRNHYLFLPYYNQLQKIDMSDDFVDKISIGSNNPIIRLTLITNPECKICAAAHNIIMDLFQKFKGKVAIDFRFLVPVRNQQKLSVKVSKRLLEIYNEEKKDVFMRSYSECYHISKDKWLLKWGADSDPIYEQQLEKHSIWCFNNNIVSTPRILINHKLIPENYHILDTEHIIEAIMFFQEKNTIDDHKTIHT